MNFLELFRTSNKIKFLRKLFPVLIIANYTSILHADPNLDQVSSFAYQLQNFSIDELSQSVYDLLIIDYSFDGTNQNALTQEDMQSLHSSNKKVLAYLSIGEAEDYRYYFKSSWVTDSSESDCQTERSANAPVWLENANPDWCGNYKVKYWQSAWQKIIFGRASGRKKSYLDQIIDAGFDGVYLDIIDAFEYWQDKPKTERNPKAAQDMAKFVIAIGKHARVTRGKEDFIVVPQNGTHIINYLGKKLKRKYLTSIQGIGAEDTFFFGDEDEDNPYNPQDVIATLDQYVDADKKVLAIDYLLDLNKIQQFATEACEKSFIPQVGNRALDNLGLQLISGCE